MCKTPFYSILKEINVWSTCYRPTTLIDFLVYVAHYRISNLKDFAGEINILIFIGYFIKK